MNKKSKLLRAGVKYSRHGYMALEAVLREPKRGDAVMDTFLDVGGTTRCRIESKRIIEPSNGPLIVLPLVADGVWLVS